VSVSHRLIMPNLTKLIAIIAITTGFGLAGCKKEPEKTQETPVAKPTEPMAKPEDTTAKPTAPTAPTAAADLPAECGEYKAAIEKIASCDKVPQQQRDALKQAYDTSSSAWATVPADGKAALAASCKSATDAIKTSASACP
jgi:hypothetical protein